MTKPFQPTTSCDTANYWRMWGKLRSTEHLKQKIVPLPLSQQSRRRFKSGCVQFLSSHASTPCIGCTNAAVLPSSGHCAMCMHVSLHTRQLGHNGLLLSWFTRYFIVPAIHRTCFAAQSWNSLGRLWSVRWIDFLSTESNCLKDRSLWSF